MRQLDGVVARYEAEEWRAEVVIGAPVPAREAGAHAVRGAGRGRGCGVPGSWAAGQNGWRWPFVCCHGAGRRTRAGKR